MMFCLLSNSLLPNKFSIYKSSSTNFDNSLLLAAAVFSSSLLRYLTNSVSSRLISSQSDLYEFSSGGSESAFTMIDCIRHMATNNMQMTVNRGIVRQIHQFVLFLMCIYSAKREQDDMILKKCVFIFKMMSSSKAQTNFLLLFFPHIILKSNFTIFALLL